jgi:hypothetical protein
MRRSEENLRRDLRLANDQIKKLMIDNPRRILGVDP